MRCFLRVIAMVFVTFSISAEESKTRLLVHIGSEAPFSAEKFAEKSSAYLVKIDTRNPFKNLKEVFLSHNFVVLSDPIENANLLKNLASRFGYRVVSFTKEGFEEALECTKELVKKGPQHSSEITYISNEESKALYDLMKKVDEIFEKNKIAYWAFAGTLLGAVRSNGIIPWDDDLDICIFDTDEQKLNLLKEELAKQGLGLYYYEQKEFYKIFPLDGSSIEDTRFPFQLRPYLYPFVDVFVMTLPRGKEESDIYIHKSGYFFWNFSEETFTYEQIKNLHRIPFGPMTISVPADEEAWLDRNYGVSAEPRFWKKWALEPTRCHRLESPMATYAGASFLKLDDFSPAPWKVVIQ